MILDTIDNLGKYLPLNPNFAKVIEFLQSKNLQELPLGRNEIYGDSVFANVVEVKPKSKEEAPIEIHRKYIDVHIPLSCDEIAGYTPLAELPLVEFVEADDAALFPISLRARDYFNIRKGEFVIFFPQDGHAPAITDSLLKKIIIKVAMP